MNQYFGLMNTISKEFKIQKGLKESEKSWKARLIYSYLGQVAYSSLFDIQEDLSPASITHFKSRISDALSSILEMYPEFNGTFSLTDGTFRDEIYDIFLKTGCIYHEPYRLTPCVRKEATGKHMLFLRGYSLEEKRFLSGIGSYMFGTENDCSGISLAEMFSLQTEPLDKFWKRLITHSKFVEVPADFSFEYLRTVPPFTAGYWVKNPDPSGDVSIARTGVPRDRIYYLYKVQDTNIHVSQLPVWQTEGYNYRSLAVGNLYTKKVLPKTVYQVDGELITLRIGYLFPPAEMNLIKLYSWPLSYIGFPHDFSRMMDRSVFEELRSFFESLGYGFKEEAYGL